MMRTTMFSAGYGALILTKRFFQPTEIVQETDRNMSLSEALEFAKENCPGGFPNDAAHFHAVVSPLGELLAVYSENDATGLNIWNAIDCAPTAPANPDYRYGVAIPSHGKYRAVLFQLPDEAAIVVMRYSELFSNLDCAVSFIATDSSWSSLEVDNLAPVILGPSDRLFHPNGDRLTGQLRQKLQCRIQKPTMKV